MRPLRSAPALALGGLALILAGPPTARAQQEVAKPEKAQAADPAKGFGSIDELRSFYDQQLVELDRRRLDDLAKLAASAEGDQANQAYQELFNLAVSRELYEPAEKAAEAYLKRGQGDPQVRGLATLINIFAQAERGEHDQSIRDIEAFLKAEPGDAKVEPNTMYAVGESFLQRLIRSHRYDVARKVCEQFSTNAADEDVKRHFAARLSRIAMLGQDAPPIRGTDADGNPVSLADLKGKVVLVDFWATWCPPCVAEVPNLRSLVNDYGEKGFAILGVNLDAAHPDIRDQDREKTLSTVRQFMIDLRVNWPSVINGSGDNDFARAYGVREIPATFVVGRDGKILHVELSGEPLKRAIGQAVGEKETTAAR